ncbi:MAG: hypothetical protein NVS2B4_17900 [Ramlibacter sp.]
MTNSTPETTLAHVLTRDGLHSALKLLNGRTAFRFTGVYSFDGDILRNVGLFDRWAPDRLEGADAPIGQTFCAITAKLNDALVVSDGRRDPRHPWMQGNSVVSYCGVPIRAESGQAIGTLCHFDDQPCQSQGAEASFLLCVADSFAPWVVARSSDAPGHAEATT